MKKLGISIIAILVSLIIGCSSPTEPFVSGHPNISIVYDVESSWAPDSNWIAYFHGATSIGDTIGVYVIRNDGTDRRLLVPFPNGRTPQWKPIGNEFVHGSYLDNHLYIYNFSDFSSRQISHDSLQKLAPAWHPNREEIIFSVSVGPDSVIGIWSLDVSSGDTQLVINAYPGQPSFSPTGDRIVYVQGSAEITTQYLMIYNLSTNTSQIILDAQVINSDRLYSPSFSSSGHQILFFSRMSAKQNPRIWIIDIISGAITLVIDGGTDPAWSPDSSKIVFTKDVFYGDEKAGNGKLWIIDLTNEMLVQLTFDSH